MTTCMNPAHFPPNMQPETCRQCRDEFLEIIEYQKEQCKKQQLLEALKKC